jgi:hypothetical protein
MRTRRIRQALALDEHFELAGFELVPKPWLAVDRTP